MQQIKQLIHAMPGDMLCGSDDIPLEDLRKLETAVQADINEIRARSSNLEDEDAN